MNIETKNKIIKRAEEAGISEDRILTGEALSAHTTFRIGGPAELMIKICSPSELSQILGLLEEDQICHMLVGNGSNLLFSDEGYEGVILILEGDFLNIEWEDGTGGKGLIRAGGGIKLSRLSSFAADNSLTGLEFACGIPGTVGGGIYMNAGAYGGELKDSVQSVDLMKADGSGVMTLTGEEMKFGYRHSILQEKELIVLSAVFSLDKGNQEEIRETMSQLNRKRNSKQPVNYPSAGSTFKRPVGGYAAALIQESGLKGFSVGGAQVSEKHSGFVINTGGATCSDVLALMEKVRDKVLQDSGIRLEPEVRIIGKDGTELNKNF